MLRKSLLGGFVIISACAIAPTRAADDAGFYVGAGIGEAQNDSGEFDGSDTAFQVFGGYAVNKYFAVEVAYVDAGTQDDRIGDIEIENESSGVIVAGLASIPIGSVFSLYGKLGYAFYDAEATARLGDLQESERDSDQDAVYGVGVELAVLRGLRIRAQYEMVDVSDGDFRVATINATYRF
jgi:OmpA-OmpF porin, OOP family